MSLPLVAHVARYLEYLARVRSLATATVDAYANDLRSFVAFSDSQSVDQVEEVDTRLVRGWIRRLGDEGLAATSVNRRLSAVKGLFAFLEREETIAANPVASVRSLRTPKRLPEVLFEQEMEQLLSFPTNDFASLRTRVLLELLYSTGARIAELCGANVDDIALRRRTLLVHGKGARDRIVFIGDTADEHLRAYLAARHAFLTDRGLTRQKALIVNLRGGRLTPRGAADIIARRLEESGLGRYLTPHGFRHSFATHILNHGADIRVVQELLGHARLSTTQVYTHVGVDRLRRIYRDAHPHARTRAVAAPTELQSGDPA